MTSCGLIWSAFLHVEVFSGFANEPKNKKEKESAGFCSYSVAHIEEPFHPEMYLSLISSIHSS